MSDIVQIVVYLTPDYRKNDTFYVMKCDNNDKYLNDLLNKKYKDWYWYDVWERYWE